ncbi:MULTISPECIES: TIGR01244 family sulfur transferase [Vibrio]|uniref:TIGR01244 family sulfur transferase n=1 Tax=Vibrio TaxID=662 RepID=UPI000C171AA4|nr:MULTISPECIES: TIGR01244 family sulfur transferase [Vibrio]NAW68722.1 TIGR01244 family phosphatase [Vibrio sp. V28_P6S34P95]NAX04547.1 TIGR01244 family phosphatase [Vibrio sp. V30_P3S12P165]NAX33539.1 TIGR01244 family phosphatase [Vibrio sp. V29_P1S30P107]NAX39068.1 TIGR01244 family phosphatase [Vibrio sp. V26_P1S5P106]NNN43333.1 TIGR01244 family phosphatase [Vibrio sp. 1-1(7)]
MLTLISLTDQVAVAPQISPIDMQDIARLGFKSVINNRPDEEEVGQPLNRKIEQEARKYQLNYYHQPVISGQITAQQVEMFTDLLAQCPKPVLAFCRTGTRCCMLWCMSSEDEMTLAERVAYAKEKGFNFSSLLEKDQ